VGWFPDVMWLDRSIGVLLIVAVAAAMHLVTRRVVVRVVEREIRESPIRWDDVLLARNVPRRVGLLVPIVVVFLLVGFAPNADPDLIDAVRRVCLAALAMVVTLVISALLNAADDIYQTHYPEAADRPIKGYLQIVNLLVFAIGAVLVVAALADRSPVVVLSGIGALTAVLLLVFQDSLSSLVSSVQLRANDALHVGDWIEVPSHGIDGEVIDLSLHSVTVRNADMTVTSLPVRELTGGSFTNWRAMYEAGGRRIQRSIHLDLTTIRFLTEDEIAALATWELLHEPFEQRMTEIARDDARPVPAGVRPSRRGLTNVSAFRTYAQAYIQRHPGLHHEGMTVLVRPLAPGPEGLPIEVYAFANETGWVAFEDIQAELFDHLLAVVPDFGLRVFQNPTGNDFGRLGPAVGNGAPQLAAGAVGPVQE
jgi:miniconductance mechanosensitive channel